MTTIVAAVFDTEANARRAAGELRRAGFESRDLDQFVLNPPGRHDQLPLGGDEHADAEAEGGGSGALTGAAIGSAVGAVAGLAATPLIGPAAIAGGLATGAYVGSLAGAVDRMGSNAPAPVARPAGVMVAVSTEFEEDQEVAVGLMRDAGARMIERAEGAWRDGHWSDFDPVRPPQIIEQNAS
jgi:hypothetical protein